MESNAFSRQQNILPTVNLLVSASSASFISLKETFQLRNYFWSHIVQLLIYYFGLCVGTILCMELFPESLKRM